MLHFAVISVILKGFGGSILRGVIALITIPRTFPRVFLSACGMFWAANYFRLVENLMHARLLLQLGFNLRLAFFSFEKFDVRLCPTHLW